jgi:hypothetical protein
LREFWCWYLKINKLNTLLEKQLEEQKKTNQLLKEFRSTESTESNNSKNKIVLESEGDIKDNSNFDENEANDYEPTYFSKDKSLFELFNIAYEIEKKKEVEEEEKNKIEKIYEYLLDEYTEEENPYYKTIKIKLKKLKNK